MLLAAIFGLYAGIVNIATNFLWDWQIGHPETLKATGFLSVILMFAIPLYIVRIAKRIK